MLMPTAAKMRWQAVNVSLHWFVYALDHRHDGEPESFSISATWLVGVDTLDSAFHPASVEHLPPCCYATYLRYGVLVANCFPLSARQLSSSPLTGLPAAGSQCVGVATIAIARASTGPRATRS